MEPSDFKMKEENLKENKIVQEFWSKKEQLETVPNPDKTPKVNVKTEGLPGKFLLI